MEAGDLTDPFFRYLDIIPPNHQWSSSSSTCLELSRGPGSRGLRDPGPQHPRGGQPDTALCGDASHWGATPTPATNRCCLMIQKRQRNQEELMKSLLTSQENKQSVSIFSTSLLLSLDFAKCFFWTLISE